MKNQEINEKILELLGYRKYVWSEGQHTCEHWCAPLEAYPPDVRSDTFHQNLCVPDFCGCLNAIREVEEKLPDILGVDWACLYGDALEVECDFQADDRWITEMKLIRATAKQRALAILQAYRCAPYHYLGRHME